MNQVVGVVLAGGAGTRMGSPKGALNVDGKPLAERAAETLWPLCGTVLISVAPGARNPAPAFAAVEDDPPAGRGPLAGIAAAFARTGSADLLVLACDYPRVTPELLRLLLRQRDDAHDLVMPTDQAGRDHPLVALWRRSAEPPLLQALEDGVRKVATLMADLRVRRLGRQDLLGLEIPRLLTNVNTAADLRALE